MMFSVIILSLAVMTLAVPEIEQKIQLKHEQKQPILPEQQVQVTPDDVNVIPFYKQVYNPYSLNLYSGYPGDRDYFGYSQKIRDHPFSLRAYENVMSYPYRNNFYLRYLNKLQPKVYYDSQDIYAYQDNVNSGYNQLISRKSSADLDSSYDLPYSPSYYAQYHTYDQGYPLVDKYYGKNLDLGYSKPSSHNIYDNLWDAEYMRRYFGRNINLDNYYPVNFPTDIDWESWPKSDEELILGRTNLKISRNLDSEIAKPTIPIRDIELVKPFTSKNFAIGSGDPRTASRQVGLEDLWNPNFGHFWNKEYNLKSGKNFGFGNTLRKPIIAQRYLQTY